MKDEHNYWLKRWQENNTAFNQDSVNPLLVKYFNDFALQPKSNVLVPLCGKSIDMLWLSQQAHQVIGVELSEIACETFFKTHDLDFEKTELDHHARYQGENITLLAGDFFQLTKTMLEPIDLIYDRAALIALPEKTRQQYAEKLIALSEGYTKILLISIDYDQSEMAGPPFSNPLDTIQKLYGQQFDVKLLERQPKFPVSSHLQEKGLKRADDLAIKLERKT